MKKVIVGKRQTGKTYDCIKNASETGAVILCSTIQERLFILDIANRIGLDIKLPMLFSEYFEIKQKPKTISIDDTERFLSYIFKDSNIENVTIGGSSVVEVKSNYVAQEYFDSLKFE